MPKITTNIFENTIQMKLSHQFLIVSALVCIAAYMRLRKPSPTLTDVKFNLEQHLKAYQSSIDALRSEQTDLRRRWKNADVSTQKKLILEGRAKLIKTIPDEVFSYWYGTKWAFHGTTKTPRKGSIACGYFVTTTLEQSGFQLPRIKMAQQAASIIIKSLCEPKSIKTYTTMPDLERYLREKTDGLFILGLDNHVGYILKRDGDYFFIHSTVGQGRKVVKESLLESKVVNRSKIKMIGDFTGNDAAVKAWIRGEYMNLRT